MNINEIALGKMAGGGLMVAASRSHDRVVVNFGCEIKYLSMTKDQTVAFAKALQKLADEMGK